MVIIGGVLSILFSHVDNFFLIAMTKKNHVRALWHFQVTGKMKIHRNNRKQLQASLFPVFNVCSKLSRLVTTVSYQKVLYTLYVLIY